MRKCSLRNSWKKKNLVQPDISSDRTQRTHCSSIKQMEMFWAMYWERRDGVDKSDAGSYGMKIFQNFGQDILVL
jgi:hypothetical protein